MPVFIATCAPSLSREQGDRGSAAESCSLAGHTPCEARVLPAYTADGGAALRRLAAYGPLRSSMHADGRVLVHF